MKVFHSAAEARATHYNAVGDVPVYVEGLGIFRWAWPPAADDGAKRLNAASATTSGWKLVEDIPTGSLVTPLKINDAAGASGPTDGQVLTATGATEADWENIPAA